jgi:hypothetical protein
MVSGYSQNSEDSQLSEQFKLSFNIVSFEAAYELPITNSIGLEAGIGLGAGNYIRSTILNSKELGASLSFKSFPPVRFRTKLKYVYNRDKRLKNGRDISYNSGNYIGIQGTFTTGQSNVTDIKNPPNNVLLTEVHWGLQRSLGGKWLFNVNAGVGYGYDFKNKLGKVYPAVGLEFAYILF